MKSVERDYAGNVSEKAPTPRVKIFNMPRLVLRYYPYLHRWSVPTSRYGGRLIDWLVGREDANLSLIPIDENIERGENVVVPVGIVEHFIRESSARYIVNYCPCRDVTDCKDYPRDIGCIWIGGAVLDITPSPDVGRLVSVEEAIEHVHKAREAGLVQLVGKWRSDPRAFGVDRQHKRFITLCNCCPCCCISRGLLEGKPDIKEVFHKLQGLTVNVDLDKCEGCGECAEACIFNNITVINKKSTIGDDCKGCGFCATVCPNKAISLRLDDPTFVNEAIERISSVVDVT
jgi:ferredoxin